MIGKRDGDIAGRKKGTLIARRKISALLSLALLFSGCGAQAKETELRQYQASFLTLFDTVTTVIGYSSNEETFRLQAQKIHDALQHYHRLFDIYEDYEGINNLKTVNDNAGIAPVKVDEAILSLLLDCRDLYNWTGGKVNVAMGSVLRLWHEAREAGIQMPERASLPENERLQEAMKHISFTTVYIDETEQTVYLSDPGQSLDVGAVAKGWAVERVCRAAPEGMIVSVGGNVCATGPRPTDGSAWIVAMQSPNGEQTPLHTLYLAKGCVVSSGDYQRYFTVNGQRYHHIIDPDTAYPATYWRLVTVLGNDSALADGLSTALFSMPLREGQALAKRCGVEVMWLHADGRRYYTAGFRKQLRS